MPNNPPAAGEVAALVREARAITAAELRQSGEGEMTNAELVSEARRVAEWQDEIGRVPVADLIRRLADRLESLARVEAKDAERWRYVRQKFSENLCWDEHDDIGRATLTLRAAVSRAQVEALRVAYSENEWAAMQLDANIDAALTAADATARKEEK